jgi:hypothetical protein
MSYESAELNMCLVIRTLLTEVAHSLANDIGTQTAVRDTCAADNYHYGACSFGVPDGAKLSFGSLAIASWSARRIWLSISTAC